MLMGGSYGHHFQPGGLQYGFPDDLAEIGWCYDGDAVPSMPGGPVQVNLFAGMIGDPTPFFAVCRRMRREGRKAFHVSGTESATGAWRYMTDINSRERPDRPVPVKNLVRLSIVRPGILISDCPAVAGRRASHRRQCGTIGVNGAGAVRRRNLRPARPIPPRNLVRRGSVTSGLIPHGPAIPSRRAVDSLKRAVVGIPCNS
jgi:hypothetical protein